MKVFIRLDENNKVASIRTDSLNRKLEGDIVVEGKTKEELRGKIMLSDGTFVEDPQDAVNENKEKAEQNKKEAYEEYKEMSDIYGFDSEKALAAKNAYIAISDECPGKCRADLEKELAQAEEDAELYMTIYMDNEGVW